MKLLENAVSAMKMFLRLKISPKLRLDVLINHVLIKKKVCIPCVTEGEQKEPDVNLKMKRENIFEGK